MLTWEKQYYAGVVFGSISVLYLTLWYLDLSLITLVSLLGLVSILMDYVFPTVSRLIFGSVNWDGDQEAKFEDVCSQVCTVKANLALWYEYLFKERKSTVVSNCQSFVAINILLLPYWNRSIYYRYYSHYSS